MSQQYDVYSQEELANLLSVDARTIRNWQKNRNFPCSPGKNKHYNLKDVLSYIHHQDMKHAKFRIINGFKQKILHLKKLKIQMLKLPFRQPEITSVDSHQSQL